MPRPDPPADRGGIIRVAHNKDNPYTLINRTFTDDPALSWEARGLLAYLLCKPDGWQVRFGDLIRRGNAGRLMLRRMLKELEAAGYLVRTCTRGAGGRWEWTSTVYEAPGVGQRPTVDRPAAERAAAEEPTYTVDTVLNSDQREYGADAPPLTEDVPALAALRTRNPTARAVQAGTAPRAGRPPGD